MRPPHALPAQARAGTPGDAPQKRHENELSFVSLRCRDVGWTAVCRRLGSVAPKGGAMLPPEVPP